MIRHISTAAKADEPIVIPGSAGTLDGFREWVTSDDYPYDGKMSFIENRIWIDMSPEELFTHNWVKKEITRALDTLAADEKIGEFCPDGVLLSNESAELSTEPDGLFFTYDTIKSGRLRIVPRRDHPEQSVELIGAPDMVVEVLSLSSGKKDRERLRRAYHRAGVREYWLIDALGEEIDFNILVAGEEDYEPTDHDGPWRYSAVFDRWFVLERERTDADFWHYHLRTR